ncbi:hypothetical protein ABFX02_12G080600 [Erythranthe guttata]
MNHCAIQQNSYSAREEIWAAAAAAASGRSVEKKEKVVCPKPRRLGVINTITHDYAFARPLRWHVSHQQEDYDAKAGNELLDIILAKGNSGKDQSIPQIASSPPFFSGSPPSRVSNPLIKDTRFGDDKINPLSPRVITPTPAPAPAPSGATAPSPSSSARKGGCVRANFGNNPAVRVEGFDCLDRDRRNCSIPALA